MPHSPFRRRSWALLAAALAVMVVASFLASAPAGAATSCGPSSVCVPDTVVLDGSRLAETRAEVLAGSSSLKGAVAELTAEASTYLNEGPWSVMDKTQLPASGNKHDYLSQATYYWPTEPQTKANPYGCPYVDKDGYVYPGIYDISDHPEELLMYSAVYYLTLAWYYTGSAGYAQRAELDLSTWFLDPATRMDPNLNYAQFIPCVNTGRGIGIIDLSQNFTDIIDAVAILNAGAPGWTTTDNSGMQTWYKEFLSWLQTSTNGAQEAAQKNNHGSFYDLLEAGLALATGQDSLAKSIVKTAETKRINVQLAANGTEPLEIVRTRSWHYSIFNLTALTRLALIGEKVGVDLWTYTSPAGGSIFKSVNYLIPFETSGAKWPYPEIDFRTMDATDVIHAAADAGDTTAEAAVPQLVAPPGGDLWQLIPAPEQLDPVTPTS
jgi:hypothetical protein